MAGLFSAVITFMQDAAYRAVMRAGGNRKWRATPMPGWRGNLRMLTRAFAETLPSDHRLYQRFQRDNGEDMRKLDDAAGVLERLAQEEQEAMLELAERDRGTALARNITGELVKTCRWIFGTPLYGCVATIASVALETPISESTIRTWYPRG